MAISSNDTLKYTLYLKVRQSSECREECHCLSRSRRSTEDHGLVFSQPGVEQGLVANSVQGRNHNVRRTNLMGLHLDFGHLVVPLSPFSLDRNLRDKTIMLTQYHIDMHKQQYEHSYPHAIFWFLTMSTCRKDSSV